MHVIGKMKPGVLQQAKRAAQEAPMQFYKTRPVASPQA
jgi:hypothetical protein